MLWVIATLVAAAAQTARNAMQSSLTATLGTLGATQVRFIYGFPFALTFLLAAAMASDLPVPGASAPFLAFTGAGAAAQIVGTALLLAAMRVRTFSVAIAFSKTEAIQVALFGLLVLGERLSAARVVAIVLATVGVVLAAVRFGERLGAASTRAALLGIASGGFYAIAAVGFRGGILALGDGGYWLRATTTLVWSLGIQTVLLGAWMAAFSREALVRSFGLWRQSLFAGFMGAFASQFWFLGISLTAAANVRTLGLVELLFAQAVSHRLFGQRLGRLEAFGMTMLAAGLALLVLAA